MIAAAPLAPSQVQAAVGHLAEDRLQLPFGIDRADAILPLVVVDAQPQVAMQQVHQHQQPSQLKELSEQALFEALELAVIGAAAVEQGLEVFAGSCFDGPDIWTTIRVVPMLAIHGAYS